MRNVFWATILYISNELTQAQYTSIYLEGFQVGGLVKEWSEKRKKYTLKMIHLYYMVTLKMFRMEEGK